MAASPPGAELGVDLVVVTPSRGMEDEATARRLLPPGARLHMASETWFSYGAGRAGTFALLRRPPGAARPWAPEGRGPEGGEVVGMATVEGPEEVDEVVRRWVARAGRAPGAVAPSEGP